ncbi:RICIN domain-containing protein [Aquimarina sp. M1]
MKTMNQNKISLIQKRNNKSMLCIVMLCFFFFSLQSQTISPWLTRGDQTVKLQEQNTISFSSGNASNPTISINENFESQSIIGFGFMLTQGSAKVIRGLNSSTQNSLLNELFNPTSGNAISVVRISIGASDLSESVYSYNQTSGDTNMNNFSLNGPDKTDVIPILKKILAINPNIRILATPWTAPTWMKTNGSWIGGSLQSQFYSAYANYFIKYLEAMKAEGIQIWAITPQNEPENPFNEPSMQMNSSEQKDFINNHLGPAIESSQFSTKIIAYDHNCDNTAYPIDVLNNSPYVDGAAFHLYDYPPNIGALSTVRNATGKNVYFTEQFTSSNGNFDGDFGWHMENVVIGSLRNWSKTVIEWNLATDPSFGPRTPGGCTECLGAITVNNSSNFNRNVSYYIIGQVSKFVKPGAIRTESNNNGILNVSFKNPDNSRVLLVYNKNNNNRNITVNWTSKNFQYTIPARSAVTFVWDNGTVPLPSNPTGLSAIAGDKEIRLTWNTTANASSYVVRRATSSNGPYTTIASNVTGTLYTDNGLTNGSTYYYRIRARNAAGTSGNSNTVNATPLASPNTGIVSGSVYEIKNKASGKSMDVSDVSLNNGARIQQWEFSGGDNQKWRVEDVGNGQYKITAQHSNKALDVVDGSGSNRAEIQQWDYFDNTNQKWKIEDVENGYFRIVSVLSNKSLDVPNGTSANGVKLIQWNTNNSDNQKWSFRLISTVRENDIIFENDIQKNTQLYPNPTNGSDFILSFYSEVLNDNKISIFDITGKEVQTIHHSVHEKGLQKIELEVFVKPLSTGRYFIKIDNQTVHSFVKH